MDEERVVTVARLWWVVVHNGEGLIASEASSLFIQLLRHHRHRYIRAWWRLSLPVWTGGLGGLLRFCKGIWEDFRGKVLWTWLFFV